MQVSVKKSKRTTRPRSAAEPSGSEFSHAVAPSSDGTRVWPKLLIDLVRPVTSAASQQRRRVDLGGLDPVVVVAVPDHQSAAPRPEADADVARQGDAGGQH